MLYWLGVGLSAQGRIEEARKAFEAALALKPDYLEPLDMVVQIADSQQRPRVGCGAGEAATLSSCPPLDRSSTCSASPICGKGRGQGGAGAFKGD